MALTDDLVAWYDFNSSGGSNAQDQHTDDAGGAQNLTDYNSVGRIAESKTGISTGQAASFNASDVEYFKSTNSDLFQSTTCTHGAVFKCNVAETGSERGRVNICGSEWSEGVSIAVKDTGGGGDFDLVASGPGGSTEDDDVIVSNISDSYIWFAFMEWDQSGVLTLYWRKKGASSWSSATKSVATSFGSPTKYMIGTTTYEDQYGIYDGWIDSVGYWTRTLSSSERNTYYNNGNGMEYGDINSPPSASLSLSRV